jgi:hypothetical protein
MQRRLAPVPILFLYALLAPTVSRGEAVVHTSGAVMVRADDTLAYPGGLFVVDVSTRRGAGSAFAVLDGRRCPLYLSAKGLRGLVPIPPTMAPGPYTLGVEVRGWRYRRRIPLPVRVVPREYPVRSVVIPEVKRSLLEQPRSVRDGRQVQLYLRTETSLRYWRGPFQPPVSAQPVYSFGAPMQYEGKAGGPVEATTDAVWGEYHRGMDYQVAPGTVVQSPAAGTVLMAADLPLTGQTLVLDHGQGVLSVFFHLGRLDVGPGQVVESRSPIAVSGDSGIASQPHVHWAVYVHGVAVDPRVMERLLD